MGTGILDEDGVLDLYELVGTGMLDEEGVRDLCCNEINDGMQEEDNEGIVCLLPNGLLLYF